MKVIFLSLLLVLVMGDPASQAEKLVTIDLSTAANEIENPYAIPDESVQNNDTNFNINSLVEKVNDVCLKRCTENVNGYDILQGLPVNITTSFLENRCVHGCKQWWRALQDYVPCAVSCTSTEILPHDMLCITSCNWAKNQYWHHLLLLLQNSSEEPPVISYTDDQTNKSLSLVWHNNWPIYYLYSSPALVQYQPEDDVVWNYIPAQQCLQTFDCTVNITWMSANSYRFRFVVYLGENYNNLHYSPATNIFQHLPNGPPTSAPLINDCFDLDFIRLGCFWQMDDLAKSVLYTYKLILYTADRHVIVERDLPGNSSYYIFENLVGEGNYTLQVSLVYEGGIGPSAEHVITMFNKSYNRSNETVFDSNVIILAGEYNIKLKTLQPQLDTQLLFESDQLISDYVRNSNTQQLFVLTVDGNIHTFFENELDIVNTMSFPTTQDLLPLKISLDWLNDRLYFAGKSMNNTWSILSTNLKLQDEVVLLKNLTHPIEQVQVDPINGWLFWRDEQSIQRLNLATNSTHTALFSKDLGYFMNDYKRYLLIVFNKADKSFIELTYDGFYQRTFSLQDYNFSQNLLGEINSFYMSDTNQVFLGTNGTHLYFDNQASNDFDVMHTAYDVEWCWGISSVFQQPIPTIPHARPTHLQALFSSSMANISWKAPPLNNFQTDFAYQQWEYELEIMDVASNNAFNIRNIHTTYFNVEKLQANNIYSLRVRIMSARQSGPWSAAITARTWPAGQHRLMLATDEGFIEANELGNNQHMLLEYEQPAQKFIQINSTLYFIGEDQRLYCKSIMSPEVECHSFAAENMLSLDFDWRGGKMYWTDVELNVVLRANLDGSSLEMLPIYGARQIALDVFRGSIYYSTMQSIMHCNLNGNTQTGSVQLYKLNAAELETVLLGFTLDTLQQRLFWLVLNARQQVMLYEIHLQDQSSSSKILCHTLCVAPDTLQYISAIDSLLWLAADRHTVLLLRLEHAAHNMAKLHLPELTRISEIRLRNDYIPLIDPEVIPEAVDNTSVSLQSGYWNDFSIKWSDSFAPGNLSVYYKINLWYELPSENVKHIMHLEVYESNVHITDLPQPQLLLHLTITPCTLWLAGPTTQLQLRTPAAMQAEPKRLRVYLAQNDNNLTAHIRWDPPENISSNAFASYKVYAWHEDTLLTTRFTNYSSDKPLETLIGDLQPAETYTFQVQAFAPGRLSGAEKTANFTLHVHPDSQALPRLLYATSEFIAQLDLDLKTKNKLVHTSSAIEHMTYIASEQRLLWVNENVELITCIIGHTPIKLARMRAEVLSLTVDWISRIVYWAELEPDTSSVAVYMLDLCQFEGRVMSGQRLLSTQAGHMIKDLLVLPFSQTLLWLEYEHGSVNATLTGRNLTRVDSALKFKNMTLLQMFEGALSVAEMETINLVDYKGKICSFDVHRQLCTPLKLQLMWEPMLRIARDNGYIYVLKNDSIRGFSRRKQNLEFHYEITDVSSIKSFNYQALLPQQCLLPQYADDELYADKLQPLVREVGENYLYFQLPKVNNRPECWLPVPGLKYIFAVFDTHTNQTRNYSSNSEYINITQLQPYNYYMLQMKIVSYYQQKLQMDALETGVLLVNTAESVPAKPHNFSAFAMSPTEISVSWQAPDYQPCARIWYQLYWRIQDEDMSSAAYRKTFDTNLTLNNLEAGMEYTLELKAFCTEIKFNTTHTLNVRTFSKPADLVLIEKNARNLTLSWLNVENLTQIVLVCRSLHEAEENENTELKFSIDITQHVSSNITVTGLEPKSKYSCYLVLTYAHVERPYQWPERSNEHFVFETLGTAPSAPGQPQIELIAGEIFKVFWAASANNGAPVLEYSLEALQARKPRRKRRNSEGINGTTAEVEKYKNRTIINILSELPWVDEPEPIEDKWIVCCNTSELSCIVRDMHTLRFLMFRVRARNEPYGWSAYSLNSEHVQEPFLSPAKRDSLVLAILAPAAIVSSCVIVLVIIRMVKLRRMRTKKLLEKSRPSVWSNLSAMQQHQIMMSRHRNLSVTSHHSTLYSGGPLSDADIALLPHISWNQITLLKFLGSGAFGEVYEGLVKYEDEEDPERVAIKSLRKGASEFSELLQEAQLMSNFRHDNIVRLVGVCCDTESISIIMEHMEGGDLLNYLRQSRQNSHSVTCNLELNDLIVMCVDVARGCSYLEEMHFVHRDLACRNCLVSFRNPHKRTVKIGDFGLARDIYKSDYYRKEGEGLLPVRWMSPESLTDGIFTTQSDVWAFGVLCWEILTYGQQPYAARNNVEVLNFVKEGGRLDQPVDCPDKLFALLLECWRFDAEERPSFARCLSTLLEVKYETSQINFAFHTDEVEAVYVNELKLKTENGSDKILLNSEEINVDNCQSTLESSNVGISINEKSCFTKNVSKEDVNDESQLMVFKETDNRTKINYKNHNNYEGVSKL